MLQKNNRLVLPLFLGHIILYHLLHNMKKSEYKTIISDNKVRLHCIVPIELLNIRPEDWIFIGPVELHMFIWK